MSDLILKAWHDQSLNSLNVKDLIDAGADVNAKDEKSKTALEYAFEQEDIFLIRALVKFGANLKMYDYREPPACNYIYKLLFQGWIDVETIQRFIEAGANVNIGDEKGFTPLHSACRAGHLSLIRILIDAGADVNAIESTSGDTPLRLIVALNIDFDPTEGIRAMEMLIDAGANVHTKNKYGENILDRCDLQTHRRILRDTLIFDRHFNHSRWWKGIFVWGNWKWTEWQDRIQPILNILVLLSVRSVPRLGRDSSLKVLTEKGLFKKLSEMLIHIDIEDID